MDHVASTEIKPAIQVPAAYALWHLCTNSDNRNRLVEMGLVEALGRLVFVLSEELDNRVKRRLLVCSLGCLAMLIVDEPARERLLNCPAAIEAAEADPPPPPAPKEDKTPSGFAPRGMSARKNALTTPSLMPPHVVLSTHVRGLCGASVLLLQFDLFVLVQECDCLSQCVHGFF